jgi:hypothetical protein
MEYRDYINLLASDHPELARQLAGFNTLENVLTWMKDNTIPLGTLEIVAQDEFCHDVLIPLQPSGPYLVFGSS